MTTITIIIPEDTPKTETNSAHNHEKIIDFSSVERTLFHFLKLLLKESLRYIVIDSNLNKETLKIDSKGECN